MKKSNSAGFAAIEAILVCVILGIIGFTGYFVWNAKQATEKSLENSASSEQASISSKKEGKLITYIDEIGNFNFSYPSDWILKNTAEGKGTDNANSTVDLTSPDKKLTVHFRADNGGKGGQCEPASTDVPFKEGNNCNTIEYLTSEMLNIKNVYYARDKTDARGNITFTYEPTSVLLVTHHFADASGEETYGLGVVNSDPNNPVQTNKPAMGFVSNQEFITVYNSKGDLKPYVYAYANSTDKDFLKSSTAEAVKTIFRSLTIDN